MTKKILPFFFFAVLAFVAALLSRVGIRKAEARAQVRPVKAYQVAIHSTESGGHSWDAEFTRRGNGDEVTNVITEGSKHYDLPSQGLRVATAPRIGKKMTFGSGRPYTPQDWSESCSPPFSDMLLTGETKIILGFLVRHVTRTTSSREVTGEVQVQHLDQWFSPVFNCFVLEERIEILVDGKMYWWQEKKATKAVSGEPPEKVFRVPQGLEEVPPDVFHPAVRRSRQLEGSDRCWIGPGAQSRELWLHQRQLDSYNRQKAMRASFLELP